MRGPAIMLHAGVFVVATSFVSARTSGIAFRELLPIGRLEFTPTPKKPQRLEATRGS